MSISMNNKLFGTSAGDEFGTDACAPTWDSGSALWGWTKSLGECGQTISREGAGADERIKFTKVMHLSGSTDTGLAVGTGADAVTLFTSTDTNTISVTFVCAFATSTSATADQIAINPHVAVSGTAAEQEGSWAGTLALKYYQSNAFSTVLDAQTSTVYIGSTMFVQSEWSVSTLANKLHYYIDSCTIRDIPDGGGAGGVSVSIVKNTCYAGAVGAAAIGDKVVGQNAQFQYTSFSFDTNSADDQELECTIKFCLPTVTNDCPDLSAVTCPTDAGFNYSI